MNIAKKTLEELVKTEIEQLRTEMDREYDRAMQHAVHSINERERTLKAAIAALTDGAGLQELVAKAEFLAVADKVVSIDFTDQVVLQIGGISIMVSPFRGNAKQDRTQKYRFIVAAVPLNDE